MRIVVNDFAGHPFQFQLSRELARRGHEVMHTYLSDLSGPKGDMKAAPGTTGAALRIEPLGLGTPIRKYSYFDRLKVHQRYFAVLRDKLRTFEPEVVISGNMPTDAQFRLSSECHRNGIRFVHWVQDFYALALETLLRRKWGPLGRLAALPFHALEKRIFAAASAVVYISDDFARLASGAGYRARKSVVIENWASLEDLKEASKQNDWSRRQGLDDKFVFLYSGTMGLKHDPRTLADLARQFRSEPDVRVVLVSEGIGRQFLENCKRSEGLENLLLFDFQPYAQLPEVLASADVLLATVEPDSSVFSVPSKILSYLCAGRPVLISVPQGNLAARVLARAEAGYVCDPARPAEFLSQARAIWNDRASCRRMGENARRYAESTFDIGRIGDLFEAILVNSTPDPLPPVNSLPVRIPQ